MAYLRCTSCGAKALAAASQCPKCAAPFHLHNARGERVKLKACRRCGILHRIDATCHWCGDAVASSGVPAGVLRSAAAIALTVTAAAGAWRYGPALRDVTENLASSAHATIARAEAARAMKDVASASASTMIASSTTNANAASAPIAPPSVATTPALSRVDSTRWEPAVARTWVNVRSDASRGGEVVGVIKPASRAMLGTDSAGWRQVRSTDVTGWVDPRLFERDSVRTRGQ